VLGGTQSLHTDAYDEALGSAIRGSRPARPAPAADHRVRDGRDEHGRSLGGSWFVESLTNEVERQVWRYLDEIDALGGMVKAIASGFPQKEIADSAYRFQREFDAGEREIVGVNVSKMPMSGSASRCSRCPRNRAIAISHAWPGPARA